jgi:hypothetical protein
MSAVSAVPAPATIALLPCPFCGGENVRTFGPYGWYRQWGISHSCKSFYNGSQEMFQGFHSEAAAIAAWNTRHRTETQAKLREALEEVNRLTSPGNRTFDEMIRDTGLACDIARAALRDTQP